MQWRHRPLGSARLQLCRGVVELVEDHLEPELIGLMDDHEQQLVVGILGERVLEVEQLVDAQVRAVISTGHDRASRTPRDQDVVQRELLRRRQLIEVA